MVLKVATGLDPISLLHFIQVIEDDLGRVRSTRWGPRTLDIDILLFGNLCLSTPELVIPHPRMLGRAFVMVPLLEIEPDLRLPDGRKPADILLEIGDSQRLKRMPEVL